MVVRDAMNPAVTAVGAGTGLEQVADLMRARGTDLLAVTDDGTFVGLVRALPTHAGAAIGEDAPVADAAHLMAALHVEALAVLDDQGRVVGLIRMGDLAPLLHGPAAAAWESTAAVVARAARGVMDISRRAIDRVVHRGDSPRAHEGATG